jgi:hypothetical protein
MGGGHKLTNADIDRTLNETPDLIANALETWRMATLEREKIEALLYLQFKGDGEKRTADELKAMVRSDGSRYRVVLDEIKAESEYTRLYERLLAAKKAASLRTAF